MPMLSLLLTQERSQTYKSCTKCTRVRRLVETLVVSVGSVVSLVVSQKQPFRHTRGPHTVEGRSNPKREKRRGKQRSFFAQCCSFLILVQGSCIAYSTCADNHLSGSRILSNSLRTHTTALPPLAFRAPTRLAEATEMHRPKHMLSQTNDETPNNARSLLEDFINAVGSTASLVTSILCFGFFAYRRNAFVLTFGIGAIGNLILSKILKKLINQDRPDNVLLPTSRRSEWIDSFPPVDKGMPSSHAMTMSFIATFIVLCSISSIRAAAANGMLLDKVANAGTIALTVIYLTLCLMFRVRNRFHSKEQVLVGVVAGVINGAVYQTLATGTNPLLSSVNINDRMIAYLQPFGGVIPVPFLLITAAVGALFLKPFKQLITLVRLKRGQNDPTGRYV